jgi:hypothetical protein
MAVSVCAALDSIEIPARQDARHGGGELALVLLQASAQISRADKPEPNAPRMLAAEGCDGSTAMLQHAAVILIMHGINVGPHDGQKELLDAKRNPFINKDNNDIFVAMKGLQNDRRKHNQTLLFKSILHRDLEATVSRHLVEMGTLAVYSTRRNKLDQLICMIRDCFLNTDEHTTPYGYAVDAHGNPSRLCFERRESKAKEYKANLKVRDSKKGKNYLLDNLEFFEMRERDGEARLKKAGYEPAMVHYEDLVAFQEDKHLVNLSYDSWCTVLKAWGVTPDENKLWTYLSNQAGIWTRRSTKSTIFNVDEVEAELKRLGREDLLK